MIRNRVFALLLLLLVALLAACNTNSESNTDDGLTEDGTAAPLDEMLNNDEEDDLLTPGAVLDAQDWLAEELGVTIEEIELVEMEEVEWQDTCLGLGGPAESCLVDKIPGYRAIFATGGQQYEVRTDAKGEGFRSPEVSGT